MTSACVQAFTLGEQAMDAGDADVVNAVDGAAEELGGDGGLFGDGDVAGAGADDGDCCLFSLCVLPRAMVRATSL